MLIYLNVGPDVKRYVYNKMGGMCFENKSYVRELKICHKGKLE